MKTPPQFQQFHRFTTARDAQMILLAAGINRYDAYDRLADIGLDPHPDADPVLVEFSHLQALADIPQP